MGTSKSNKEAKENIKEMKESIIKYGEKIFIKYLDGRQFNAEKVSSWQENIIDDLLNYCKENYTNYNFLIISFLASGSSSYNSSASGILNRKTDDYFSFNNGTNNNFHIEIRVFFFIDNLKPKGNYNSLENSIIKKNIEINEKILDEKKYSFSSCDKYINLIPKELTDYILKFDKSRYYYCVIYLVKNDMKEWFVDFKYSGDKPINSKITEIYRGKNIEGINYIFSW